MGCEKCLENIVLDKGEILDSRISLDKDNCYPMNFEIDVKVDFHCSICGAKKSVTGMGLFNDGDIDWADSFNWGE